MNKRDKLRTAITDAKEACKIANAQKLDAIRDYREAKTKHKIARLELAAARKALAYFDNHE